MDTLAPWISILGLPIASGINLYATVLVLGVGQRFGWIEGLPTELGILAHPVVLAVAGVLYVVEFFADKIPFLDTLWDGLHTFIRPAGAAFLALNAAADFGPGGQFLAMLLGGMLGLGAHSTKAGTRLLVNTSPEPVSNSVVSVAEDFGVVGLLALVYSYPWAALGVIVALIALMAAVTPLLFRVLRFFAAGFGGLFASWFGAPKRAPDQPPDWLARQIRNAGFEGEPLIVPCFARNVGGAPLLQLGYLLNPAENACFAFKTPFRERLEPLVSAAEPALRLEKKILCDVFSAAAGPGRSTVYVSKDWSRVLQEVLERPRSQTAFAEAGAHARRG